MSSHKTSKQERQTTFVLVAISILLLVLIYRKSEAKKEAKAEVKAERFAGPAVIDPSLAGVVGAIPLFTNFNQREAIIQSKKSEYFRYAEAEEAQTKPPFEHYRIEAKQGSKGAEHYRIEAAPGSKGAGPVLSGVDPKVMESYIRRQPAFSL